MVFNHNVILVLCKISFHKSMLKCSAGYELGWLCYQILWSPLGFPLESELRHDHIPSQKRSTFPLERSVNDEHTEQTVSTHWTEFGEWWANAERKRSAKQTHDEHTVRERYVNARMRQDKRFILSASGVILTLR